MTELVASPSVNGSSIRNESKLFVVINITLKHFRLKIILIPKAFKNVICLDLLWCLLGSHGMI